MTKLTKTTTGLQVPGLGHAHNYVAGLNWLVSTPHPNLGQRCDMWFEQSYNSKNFKQSIVCSSQLNLSSLWKHKMTFAVLILNQLQVSSQPYKTFWVHMFAFRTLQSLIFRIKWKKMFMKLVPTFGIKYLEERPSVSVLIILFTI